MAAARPLITVQSLKSNIATSERMITTSARANIVHMYGLSCVQKKPVTLHVPHATRRSKTSIVEVIDEYKQFEAEFRKWVNNQPLLVAAPALTLVRSFEGGFCSWLIMVFYNRIFGPVLDNTESLLVPGGFQPLADSFLEGSPLIVARNFAILTGVDALIFYVLKRLRGKHDLPAGMVAGFVAGYITALVTGTRGLSAISCGVVVALMDYVDYKTSKRNSIESNSTSTQRDDVLVDEKSSQPEAEDISYNKTRDMLSSLGFDHYEKKFKDGLLTDKTLPLLTESVLQDVGIPAGERLLILDYIRREKEDDMKIESEL